jgi:acetyl esterase/lipase
LTARADPAIVGLEEVTMIGERETGLAAANPELARLAERYDPRASYEVRVQDLEYRREGDESWLVRIYQPEGSGPFPALLEVHGGAWADGDRIQNEPIDRSLAASGLVVAAIDFRNSGHSPYPAAVQDVNYATRWLKAHAADFNASPEALGGAGFSSGGHLMLLSAMRPRDPRYAALPLDSRPELDASVAYVIAGWPVIDPYARYQMALEQGKQRLAANGEQFFGDQAGMREGNPQQVLERGESVEMPPVLILMGSVDANLTETMAERFVTQYARVGGLVELGKYHAAPHGFAREPGPNTSRALAQMKSFVGRQLEALAVGW